MRIVFVVPLLALAASLTGCINMPGWHTVEGSGNLITQTREVNGFDQVAVSGSGQLILSQGQEESLSIEADDNLLPLIESEVVHGHLSIGPRNVNLRPTQTIVYRLKVKRLSALSLSGSVRAEAVSLRSDRLSLHLSGSGKVHIDQLDAETLQTHISGSGSTSASGRVNGQEVSISGSGNHHAANLKSSRATARISGSGHAWLWVTDSLNTHISGSGRVEYRGTPRVDSHVSGSGRVVHRAEAE
jgi:hypothetical protein